MADPEELLRPLTQVDLASTLRTLRHIGSLPIGGLGPPPNPNEGFNPWDDDGGSSGDREPRNPKTSPPSDALVIDTGSPDHDA
jgi:hypothetical protein